MRRAVSSSTGAAEAPAARGDLLGRLQDLIERTYALERGPDAAAHVIGDAGLTALYGAAREDRRPMLLIRHRGGEHLVRVYYPDSLVENLEAHDPCRGLNEHNLRDFAAFVEELDHFLQVVACVRAGREVSAVELELHANVTKTLVAWLFLARTLRRERLDPGSRAAVLHELLERGDYGAEEPELRDRYRDARHHAIRFLRRIEREPPASRAALLRRFSVAPLSGKLALCG